VRVEYPEITLRPRRQNPDFDTADLLAWFMRGRVRGIEHNGATLSCEWQHIAQLAHIVKRFDEHLERELAESIRYHERALAELRAFRRRVNT
jgi:hypothetical protein